MVLKLALSMEGGVGVVAAYALFQAWAGQVILVTLSIRNKLREFDKRSKHSSLSDYFINPRNLFV